MDKHSSLNYDIAESIILLKSFFPTGLTGQGFSIKIQQFG
jgi:hypothetical protein